MSKDYLNQVKPGQVVEFLEDSVPKIGMVSGLQNNRVRVLTSSGREKIFSANRILPWLGPNLDPTLPKERTLDALRKLHLQREELSTKIKVQELWELVYEESKAMDVSWLAELYFAHTPEPNDLAGLGRALLLARIFFKFKPPFFLAYSPEQVAKLQKEQEEKRFLAQLIEQGRAIFKDALKGKASPVLANLDPQIRLQLKEILLAVIGKYADAKQNKLFSQLTSGLGDDEFLAFGLAKNLGFIPEHFNHHLLQAGYEFEPCWQEFEPEIQAIRKQSLSWPTTPELTGFISIDSQTTQDIDDAFCFQPLNNGYLLQVAISCPVLDWQFDSALDLKVRERTSSLYLPEGTSHMLPEPIGIELYSLQAKQIRPALVFAFKLDEDAKITSFELDFKWIQVKDNLSYAQADSLIKEQKEFWPQLYQLSQMLRKQRIDKGAVIIEQPQPQISLSGQGAEIKVLIQPTKDLYLSHIIVSELMILSNFYAAKWAWEHQLPLFFRSQKVSLSKDMAGVWTHPKDIYNLVKQMAPSILDLKPEVHASLGVEMYTSITSPLRRYLDFLNMAQILNFLKTKAMLFSQEQLQTMLSYLSARQSLVGQVQRFRPRYWKLLYFKQNPQKKFLGVLVEKGEHLNTFILPEEQVIVRAPANLLKEKNPIGEKYLLSFGKIDPLRNEIKVVKVEKQVEKS